MYIILLLLLMTGSTGILVYGLKQHNRFILTLGIFLIVVTIGIFWFLGFWGEYLWFAALGFRERFFTELFAKIIFAVAGALFSCAIVCSLTASSLQKSKSIRYATVVISLFIGGNWGIENWDILLRFLNRVMTDVSDPILGKNVGFYLFSLPFYDVLYQFLLFILIISLGIVILSELFRVRGDHVELIYQTERDSGEKTQKTRLYLSAALLLFVVAWGKYLSRFHLMYSEWGAVTGAGWTDVHIRLPAYLLMVVVSAVLGIMLLTPWFRNPIYNKIKKYSVPDNLSHVFVVGIHIAVMLLFWFVALVSIPGIFQWLRVEPNEITFENEYIANNIEYTRYGFNLHEIEEREFPVSGTFTRSMIEENRTIFDNIRLWDWRALDMVYQQFQEIRLYYEFEDVDIDRYYIGDDYRQVMVSARELELDNLPAQSQTFVNRRFKYTHGYGITLTTVNEFTPDGQPHLLVKDIPPKSEYPELEVERPQIYYGMLTDTPVIVNTKEGEFDYPSGEENIYINYPGTGGVRLSGLWRKFLFGWKFDGTKFFLSGYPDSDSRIMFNRQIYDRINKIAPFITLDRDPYIVLHEGKLFWIIDGFTTSNYYPYSEPISLRNTTGSSIYRSQYVSQTPLNGIDDINYIRNSIKIVVDAFNGSVDYYVFEPDDPVVQVWQNIFPGLFKNKEDMPRGLLEHVRYPVDMLLVQGLVYTKYHMNDPTVFYNQEDLWIRATEKYYNNVQTVEPYYLIWEPPFSNKPEFVLMMPFTPKNRQVLIGWIAGMCDPENYGTFLAYKFPKEKRVLGTQQVETKIDQDSYLSGQLSLWDQRGSQVIRGNVLAIPVEETMIYVEPIYLQAESAAYPELRLVAVMHDDNLSYAESFEEALEGLFDDEHIQSKQRISEQPEAVEITSQRLIDRAAEAFGRYIRAFGEKQYSDAADALEDLEQFLQRLQQNTDTQ